MGAKTTSERVSVRGYHLPYLKTFGEAMGTNDLSEIVNHILNCHRLGCHNLPPSQTSTTTETTSNFTPSIHQSDDEQLVDALGDMFAA